ncbi:MAG TPA: hypothetical protein ENK18_08860 [Deltaproteobacteria bacterium]|nr:hypothetical protein [Deltaproteobacteria bacterium]
MSQHVPADLLQAFVEGEVGEQLSVHIAQHVDDCPSCATRAAGLEPLASVFAAVKDPIPPPDLTQVVLSQLERPERVPTLEISVGAALLACASILALGIEGPTALATDLSVVVSAFASLGRGLQAALGSFQLALSASTALAALGVALTLHFASLPPKTSVRRAS